LTVASAVLALPLTAVAQRKLPTIGLLGNDAVIPSPRRITLLNALRERGYIAGRDVQIEDRISLEGYGGMTEHAADLVRANVDLIVALGATATIAAAKSTGRIPIVMISALDAVSMGFAVSLAQPGRNLTGVTTIAIELNSKRLQLLAELVPGMSRVGVLIATGSSASALNRREVENAASKLGLEPVIAEVREVNDLENAFTTLSRSRVDALYVPGSTMLSAHGASVARLAAKHKLPAMYTSDRFVDAGGLIGYGADINSAIVHASAHVDRILKGAKPGDLPIEQVSKLELIVNLKSAREMDLKIPRSVLLQADRVID
jgi:putative ABC transport system substrate-binding protein